MALAASGSTVYYVSSHISAIGKGRTKVTLLNSSTGKETKDYTLSVDLSQPSDSVEVWTSPSNTAPFLIWAEPKSKTVTFNLLGSTKTQTISFESNDGQDLDSIKVHLSLSPRFLIHARSKLRSWAQIWHVDEKSTSATKAYDLPAVTENDAFTAATVGVDDYFVRITDSEVTLYSSESHGILGRWPRSAQIAQPIAHATVEIVARSKTSFASRIAGISISGEWNLIRNGENVWSRYEDLTNAVAAAWANVAGAAELAQELEAESHSSLLAAYLHRVRRHIRDLQELPKWLQNIPQSILKQLSGEAGSDKSYLTSQKAIIVATDGWLYSLDATNAGNVVWRTQIPPVGRHRRRPRHLSIDGPQGTLDIDGAFTVSFNIDRGDITAMNRASYFSTVVEVPTSTGTARMYIPQDGPPQGVTGAQADGNFLITLDSDQKVQAWTLNDEPQRLWAFTPPPGFKIVEALSRPSHDPVASIGKVLGDRNVLYKYLSPNLALITTTSTTTLSVYLLDAITGTILHSNSHSPIDPSVSIASAISENWIAYTFFSDNSASSTKAQHLRITELYESALANDRGPLGSTSNYSTFDPETSVPIPHAISQTFILPQPISDLAVTVTAQGITSRSLLAYLPSTSSIIAIPRQVLDPRRPVNRDPTAMEAAEEGLMRYSPFLDLDPKWSLSHMRELLGIEHIMSTPTILESSSLIFAYGHDLFGTRAAPSMAFDVLGNGFSRGSLVATVVALGLGVAALAPAVRKKMVAGRWKGFY